MLQLTGRAKKLVCLLLALAGPGLLCVSHAQQGPVLNGPRAQTAGGQHTRPLRLTTSIVEQRYCRNDDGSLALSLRLRLRYTNVGHQPVILYKGSKLIHRHTTSRDLKDAEAGQFTSDYSLTIYSGGGIEINESSLDSLFVTLQPEAPYEREALNVVVLPVTSGAAGTAPATLRPGEYVLQVTTSTWPESEELAQELRTRWQQRGLLWTDVVTSMPMPFKVEEPGCVSGCL